MRRFTFKSQVITGGVMTIVCIFCLGIGSYQCIKKVQEHNRLISSSKDIFVTSQKIGQYTTLAEANQRLYLVTGQQDFLRKYRTYKDRVSISLNDLRRIIGETDHQSALIDSLAYYVSAGFSEIESSSDLRSTSDPGRLEFLKIPPRVDIENIHRLVSKIGNISSRRISAHNAGSALAMEKAFWVTGIGCLSILIMVLVFIAFIRRTLLERNQIERRLLESNKNLGRISAENEHRNWLLAGSIVVDEAMRGLQEVDVRAKSIVTEISKYLKADVGAIYIADDQGDLLQLSGTYAYKPADGIPCFRLGEGLVGQVALERRGAVFSDIPSDYMKVRSALGSTRPCAVIVYPFIFQGQLKAVIELGFTKAIPPDAMEFFNKVSNSIAVGINAAQARVEMQALFDRSQTQAEALEAQQEELRTTNEELVNKTEELQASEEELRVQQEELRQANRELEEQARQLEERNRAINEAREAISLKAEELEQTSKYKSEFLANMSHELRTPLNSILILARILQDNKLSNLNEEQIKYARVIHNAGNDLLTLINDILDLSKVESGMMDLNMEDVRLADVKQDLESLFNEVAGNKRITFQVHLNPSVPVSIISDRVRIEQIVRNLLSNAFKFTSEGGSVTVNIDPWHPGLEFTSDVLKSLDPKDIVSISVTDTGIGIPEEKQKLIFEAFRQADGSTSRKYGGTGLGLSISRELAVILGGEISVSSVHGSGSTFTLFLPVNKQLKEADSQPIVQVITETPAVIRPVPFILEKVSQNTSLLIIEDDVDFSDILKDYAIDRGFRPLIAYTSEMGLEMARKHQPDAIILDVMLPGMDGWKVLKQLKSNPETKRIPVHMMSAGDEKEIKAEREGAVGFLKKPVEKEALDGAFNKLIKNGALKLAKVLVVEDHEIQSDDLKRKFLENNIKVVQAFNGQEAKKILQDELGFDCLILDVNLPDISGLDLLDEIRMQDALRNIPVIINTAMELDKITMARVMEHTDAMVLKNIKSNDRLLDEVNLFMNKVKTTTTVRVPDFSSSSIGPGIPEKVFQGKTILIADDDMRNIFALSTALQSLDLSIEIAHDGREALTALDSRPEIDLVLMDVMMPGMDGYEAMKEIRKQHRFKQLPIIALTAKAMKIDRDKCISAGANDYISKPVAIDRLLSLIRVWLS